jgi:hypothetical protein
MLNTASEYKDVAIFTPEHSRSHLNFESNDRLGKLVCLFRTEQSAHLYKIYNHVHASYSALLITYL